MRILGGDAVPRGLPRAYSTAMLAAAAVAVVLSWRHGAATDHGEMSNPPRDVAHVASSHSTVDVTSDGAALHHLGNAADRRGCTVGVVIDAAERLDSDLGRLIGAAPRTAFNRPGTGPSGQLVPRTLGQ